ncbi:hypothetical protein C7E12_19995, partial [Stenotrophomonas maltophilia]
MDERRLKYLYATLAVAFDDAVIAACATRSARSAASTRSTADRRQGVGSLPAGKGSDPPPGIPRMDERRLKYLYATLAVAF